MQTSAQDNLIYQIYPEKIIKIPTINADKFKLYVDDINFYLFSLEGLNTYVYDLKKGLIVTQKLFNSFKRFENYFTGFLVI